MANDAFALSPMSASGTLPTEADYHAINEAFMETSRGRWFLKEYARRNRNADTAVVLEAVTRIEAGLAAQKQGASATGLTEAMDAIRAIIEDGRTQAARAFEQVNADEAFLPARNGIRIIQEVTWRLREIGYDGRICDILEAQAGAIGVCLDAPIAQGMQATVLASFDAITQQIGGLTDAPPSATPAPPPADLTEARLAREKIAVAEASVSSRPPAPVQALPIQTAAASPVPENVVSLTAKPPLPAAPARPTPPLADERSSEILAMAGLPQAATLPPAAPPPSAPATVAADRPASFRVPPHRSPEPVISSEASVIRSPEPPPEPVGQSSGQSLGQSLGQPLGQPLGQSLGQALLARGVVPPAAAKIDPLAQLRRMSSG